MSVIKAKQAPNLVKEAIVLDLGDLSRQASRLRTVAESKATEIVEDAQREAAHLVEKASVEGFEEGRAAGFAQGFKDGRTQGHAESLAQRSEQLKQIEQAWRMAADSFGADRADMHRQAHTAVLDLALRIAEKLVHRVIEVDRTTVIDQLGQALSYVICSHDVTVRICPDDRSILEEAMPDLLTEFSQFEHVRLVDDAKVGCGGCVVTYGQGQIDATIGRQIDRVVDLLLPMRNERNAIIQKQSTNAEINEKSAPSEEEKDNQVSSEQVTDEAS